ncbi:MAG: trypsin-like serine protease [Symploca sp. SIO2C1]|nr:trypsin-like serine protease [Symploca sp. SIO2C1]
MSFTQLLVTSLTLASVIISTKQSVSSRINFECINSDKGYATIAVNSSGKQTNTLIHWNFSIFADSFYTQQQCKEVTERLNLIVANNENQISDLLLTTDFINGKEVICWVYDFKYTCKGDGSNLLLVIPSAQDPKIVLRQLFDIPDDLFSVDVPLRYAPIYLKLGATIESQLAELDNLNSTSLIEVTAEVENPTDKLDLSDSTIEESVQKIARQITVRIFTNLGAGSGIIIKRQGQTYTVLTNAHVADGSFDEQYTILTGDGRSHPAHRKDLSNFGGIDLALVEFESENSYEVAVLRNSKITIGEQVYAAGFPNYIYHSKGSLETFEWGLRAFQITTGNLEMLMSEPSLSEGYKMGYTNDVEVGMSGGPVLDSKGQVIGLNGRGKYPIQGIEIFALTDGTYPSPELFQKMNLLSWAIPISIFKQITNE